MFSAQKITQTDSVTLASRSIGQESRTGSGSRFGLVYGDNNGSGPAHFQLADDEVQPICSAMVLLRRYQPTAIVLGGAPSQVYLQVSIVSAP